jgi:MFS family permease
MKTPFLDSPAFRQSRAVLLTTFTNKVGSIGLSLVSILLVRRGASTTQGTLVLSSLKAVSIVGTLAGGALSDRFDTRALALAALLLSATGMGLMPFPSAIALILLCGILAQFAESLMNVVQRLLLVGNVESAHHKESLGWLRMVSNFAQIFSFSIAALGSAFGVAPLMLFDAATSLVAFAVGRKILPRSSARAQREDPTPEAEKTGPSSLPAFVGIAVVLLGWSLMYELFLEGGSGRLEVLHPGEGLRRFSTMMILNTILCAAFAIPATRLFRDSWRAIAGGVVLMAAGVLIAGWGMATQAWVFGGMLCITVGELMLGAVAQYTLMRLTPAGRNAGFYYSTGLTLMQCGRIVGAGLAFPLLIRAADLTRFTALIVAVPLIQLAVLFGLRSRVRAVA